MSIAAVLAAFNEIPRELILPPTSLFVLMLIGLLIRRRFPLGGRVLTGGSIVALFVLSTGAGSRLFVAPLERLTVPLQAVHNTGAQAIVVLAAGRVRNAPEYDGRDIPDYIALAHRMPARRVRRGGRPYPFLQLCAAVGQLMAAQRRGPAAVLVCRL